MEPAGKSALVTGAAGGIGRAIALRLAFASIKVTFVLCLVLALWGCGGEQATADLPDDRYFGYIRSVDSAATPATITFDDAEFLTGTEAEQAARDEGAIAADEPLSNDWVTIDGGRVSRIDEQYVP